jgi:hypothetical protein
MDKKKSVLKEFKDGSNLVETSWKMFCITQYFIFEFQYSLIEKQKISLDELKSEEAQELKT